jgi:sugar lactone lactonase YvrE
VVLSEVTCSNGLGWSPDGARGYYVDSLTHRVDLFDQEPVGGPVGRRPFVIVPESAGLPDGLTVDSEGAVWVALFGGSGCAAICRTALWTRSSTCQ